MSNAIELIAVDGEPRIDSRLIASRLHVNHKNSVELIGRYRPYFLEHGLLPFETEAVSAPGGRGAKHRRYYRLNEDQCYFLLSLSRNNATVVALKSDLVRAFGAARRAGHAESITAWQQLQRLEIENASSLTRASIGSRLMLERKRALPGLRRRRDELESQVIVPMFALRT